MAVSLGSDRTARPRSQPALVRPGSTLTTTCERAPPDGAAAGPALQCRIRRRLRGRGSSPRPTRTRPRATRSRATTRWSEPSRTAVTKACHSAGAKVCAPRAVFAVAYGDETVRCRLDLADADRRTGSPHRTITLRRRPDGVRVTVTDTNTDPPTSREPDEDAEGGRGLALISGIAEHFGTVVRRDSKDVWAEIPTSRPAALA
ncbi:hypothetical protein ABID94_006465 [Streptomyces sp. PvR018]